MAKEFSFEADDKKVEQVLFSHRKFRVPRYQRPYAWNIEQISEFWSDLITSSEPYFMGSLVFCTETEKEDGFVEIIDGQQRLLTITIFMAVLRDHAKTINPQIADKWQDQDIALLDRSLKRSYRIEPDETLHSFFEKYIQKDDGKILEVNPNTPEETRVKQNYEYLFHSVFKELERFESQDAKLDLLHRLRKKVSELVIINVEIEREEDAYEIFETTNARGLDLSVSDLLKNLIFKKVQPGNDKDFAKEVWQEITANVQATDTELKKFIRYYWLSKHSQITEKRLYREIKNRITDWHALLNDLWDASLHFNTLLEGNQEAFDNFKNGHKIYNSLFALRLMEVTQCYVLFLSVLRNYAKLETDPNRLFQLIEKFSFQYNVVCNLPANRVEKIYTKYALELEKACQGAIGKGHSGKIQALFSQLEKELKDVKPSYAVFKDSFDKLGYKSSEKGRRLTKYILAQIDSHLRPTKENIIDFNNVNIEHLLPQNPDDEWKLSKKEIKPYVNKLGNLTLIDKRINSRVQNKQISEKIKELEQSALPITQEVVSELVNLKFKWGSNEISQRQARLCEVAYNEIWAI